LEDCRDFKAISSKSQLFLKKKYGISVESKEKRKVKPFHLIQEDER